MAYVKIDLSKTKEPECAAEGEYSLRIVKAVDTETKKKGEPMTVLTIRVEDAGPNVAAFNHYLLYPNGGEYDAMRSLEIKRLLTIFDVPYDGEGFDSQAMVGQEARCLLVQEQGDDGIIRNKMRLPRMKE